MTNRKAAALAERIDMLAGHISTLYERLDARDRVDLQLRTELGSCVGEVTEIHRLLARDRTEGRGGRVLRVIRR